MRMPLAPGAGRAGFTALLALAAGILLTFLALPLVALFTQAPLGEIPPLLSPGRALLVPVVELPLVLPPAVAGIGLLAAFSAGGLLGTPLEEAGIVIPFTQWAVVMAITFVASPFYVRQAIASFEAVDPQLQDASRTLGVGPARTFLRVSLPLAAGGLIAGWVLAFARGIGEFGATIMFAGNVPGVTQTLTLGIYEQLDANFDLALAIGVLLVILSAGVLLAYKMISSWRTSISTSTSPFRPSRSLPR